MIVDGKAAALQKARLPRPFAAIGRCCRELFLPDRAGAFEFVGQVGDPSLDQVGRYALLVRRVWRRRAAPSRAAWLRT